MKLVLVGRPFVKGAEAQGMQLPIIVKRATGEGSL